MKAIKILLLLGAAAGLAACDVAEPSDKGWDRNIGGAKHLSQLKAGVWIDPEGCDHWIIDDGVEGYSGRRFDPVSGLPVCNNHYPPGTVIREYQTRSEGIADWTPGPGIKTVVVKRCPAGTTADANGVCTR